MSAIGTWIVNFDWQHTGNYLQANLEVKADGTVDAAGAAGLWSEEGGLFVMRFPQGPGAVYVANRVADSMTGMSTVFNNFNGCWFGTRATIPTPQPIKAGSHNLLGERQS